MTHVNTVKTNSTTYTYDQLQQMMANGTLDTSSIKDVSVFNASSDSSQCTDGKDDGKIGFFSALGSTIKGAVKGVVNGVKGMFTDDEGNFSLGKTLKTALTVGACFIPGVGPVIAGGLCAYGAVKGGVGIAKGVAAAATATTDAEKKAAFESIGANGVATAASVAGLKASVNAIAGNAGVAAESGSLVQNVKNLATTGEGNIAKNLASNVTKSVTNYYQGTWSNALSESASTGAGKYLDGAKAVGKQAAEGTAENIIGAGKALQNKASQLKEKVTGKKPSASGETIYGKSEVLQENTTLEKVTDGLPEADVAKIKALKEGQSYTTADGTKIKYTDKGYTSTTSATKTTIQENVTMDSLEKVTGKKIGQQLYDDAAIAKAEGNGGSAYVQKGGTQYYYDPASETLITTKNISNTGYNVGNLANNTAAGTANGVTYSSAALATTANAISNSASDIENQIPYASTSYATVNTQTGYEYDLEDYTILSADEVNQKYANIMNQTYAI